MTHRHVCRVRAAACGLAVASAFMLPAAVRAQFTEPPPPAAYALRNVTLVRADGTREPGASVVVRGARIEAAGRGVAIPADARVLAGDSLLVYPGLFDAAGAVKFEFPRDTMDRSRIRSWDPPRLTQGFTPSRRVLDHLAAIGSDGAELRRKGVVAVAVHPASSESLMGGRGALVLLRRDARNPQQLVLQPVLAPTMSFRGGRGVYPNTGMAVMSWYRQTFLDAQRQLNIMRVASTDPAAGMAAPFDPDYAVVQEVLRTQGRVFFVASDVDEIRRVLALADEFRFQPVIVGGAEAWKVASELKAKGIPVLVYVDIVKPRRWKPDANDSVKAVQAQDPGAMREKKQLEEAYANAAKLAQAGVSFALVSGGSTDLREGVRKAMEYGLDEAAALRAVTATPASLYDVAHLSRIQPGLPATFVVTDGPIFGKDTRVLYTFVEGSLEKGTDPKAARTTRPDSAGGAAVAVTAAGTWEVEITGAQMPTRSATMTLTQEAEKVTGTMSSPDGDMELTGSLEGTTLTLNGSLTIGGQSVALEFNGVIHGDEIAGKVKSRFGDMDWKARRKDGNP